LGVNLTPLIEKKILTLNDLRGRSFAVDAYVILHQFLALIRMRDGTPLVDLEGHVTSHLVGLAFRTTRLIADYGLNLIFVFDGVPPEIKMEEVEKRRKARERAEEEYRNAVQAGFMQKAFSKAVMTGRLTTEGVADAKTLLTLLGISWVQAPGEGEAEAAYITRKGDVWACNSQDYDSLLYGAPRLVRYITIQGEEWLPSLQRGRKLEPEIIELERQLNKLQLTREQLIDLAILIGTDYNKGIPGVGPKKALKMIREYGCLEDVPLKFLENMPRNITDIRHQFLSPEVTDNYTFSGGEIDEAGLYNFLCRKHNFSKEHVDILVNRMKKSQHQKNLNNWLK